MTSRNLIIIRFFGAVFSYALNQKAYHLTYNGVPAIFACSFRYEFCQDHGEQYWSAPRVVRIRMLV